MVAAGPGQATSIAGALRTSAVLPVKSFARAKQRLGGALGADVRRELAQAMVGDVLSGLDAIDGLEAILVVTAEPWAAEAAREAGAFVVPDPDEHGQSPAAARGIVAAVARGAERVLLVPGDCPLIDAGEVERLLAAAPAGPSVLVVPDRHGTGTNGLLLTPPGVIAPAFGEGSFARHVARTQAAGAALRIAEAPSLALDVDTPEDLAAVRAVLDGAPDRAPRTRAALERLVSLAG